LSESATFSAKSSFVPAIDIQSYSRWQPPTNPVRFQNRIFLSKRIRSQMWTEFINPTRGDLAYRRWKFRQSIGLRWCNSLTWLGTARYLRAWAVWSAISAEG